MNLEIEHELPTCPKCGDSVVVSTHMPKNSTGESHYCYECGLVYVNANESPRKMQVSLIATVSRNGVIGIDGRLPMRLPADLRRFRIMTSNKPVIMGRKTHDSIGKTLLNRTNIVISNQKEYPVHQDSILVPGVPQAYEVAYSTGATHAFVIGGREIFRYFLLIASKIYLTVIDEELEGDTFFPISTEAMLKWDGRLIQKFEKSPTNAAKHLFYIFDVPSIEELADLYDDPPFENMHKWKSKNTN